MSGVSSIAAMRPDPLANPATQVLRNPWWQDMC
jgi:hypothetical protein